MIPDPVITSIAVIDSDDHYLELVGAIIRSLRYRPILFRAPIGDKDIATLLNADLILTDLFMPEFDGFELIRAVRAVNRRVPIIAMASINPVGTFYLRAARSLGANFTLSKVTLAQDLPDMLRQACGQASKVDGQH